MTLAGFHSVDEQLRRFASDGGANTDLRGTELLYVDSGRGRAKVVSRARQLGIAVRRVSAKRMDDLAHREAFGAGAEGARPGQQRHDGVLLRILRDRSGASSSSRAAGRSATRAAGSGASGTLRDWLQHVAGDSVRDLLVLAVDGITDPMNLGSILRSADQFEVTLVITPRRRSAPLSAAVHRASAGAASHVHVLEVSNLDQALGELRRAEVWLYGADTTGEPISAVNVAHRAALVLGAEGSGLHRLTRERCDQLVRIPTGGVLDSLNVGVAAGVLLYEIRRQWAAGEVG